MNRAIFLLHLLLLLPFMSVYLTVLCQLQLLWSDEWEIMG